MGTVSRIFACLSITASIMTSMIVLLGLVSASSALVVPQQVLVTFHSQDELGGYEFGYSGGPSSRHEVKDHLGVVRGAWNLVDDGGLQSYKYISDGLGYRLLIFFFLLLRMRFTSVLVRHIGPRMTNEVTQNISAT